MGEVISITYFTAPWCAPCKVFGPTLLSFAGREGIIVEKIDVDNNLDRAREFDVMSVPTTVWFKDGTPVASFTGAMSEPELIQNLKAVRSASI